MRQISLKNLGVFGTPFKKRGKGAKMNIILLMLNSI